MKNLLTKTLTVAALLATSAHAMSQERIIFNEGLNSAVKVMQYEKENSMNGNTLEGKYCLTLRENGLDTLKTFTVVRLEAMSLLMEYSPAFLLSTTREGASKNIFCFAQGDTKKEVEAKLRAVRSEYPKIDENDPKVIHLSTENAYERIVPSLGKWSKDMSGTISTLNEKVSSLQKELTEQIESAKERNKQAEEREQKIYSELKSIMTKVKSSAKNTHTETSTSNHSTGEKVKIEESPYAFDSKKEKAAKKEKKKTASSKEPKIVKSEHSQRVLIVEKK